MSQEIQEYFPKEFFNKTTGIFGPHSSGKSQIVCALMDHMRTFCKNIHQFNPNTHDPHSIQPDVHYHSHDELVGFMEKLTSLYEKQGPILIYVKDCRNDFEKIEYLKKKFQKLSAYPIYLIISDLYLLDWVECVFIRGELHSDFGKFMLCKCKNSSIQGVDSMYNACTENYKWLVILEQKTCMYYKANLPIENLKDNYFAPFSVKSHNEKFTLIIGKRDSIRSSLALALYNQIEPSCESIHRYHSHQDDTVTWRHKKSVDINIGHDQLDELIFMLDKSSVLPTLIYIEDCPGLENRWWFKRYMENLCKKPLYFIITQQYLSFSVEPFNHVFIRGEDEKTKFAAKTILDTNNSSDSSTFEQIYKTCTKKYNWLVILKNGKYSSCKTPIKEFKNDSPQPVTSTPDTEQNPFPLITSYKKYQEPFFLSKLRDADIADWILFLQYCSAKGDSRIDSLRSLILEFSK